jgi:hypothetical protein
MPKVHSTFVQGFSEKDVESHWRPEEYKQGGVFQIWSDAPAGLTLVHMHTDDHDHHGNAAHGRLTDYNKKLTWSWDYEGDHQGDRKIVNCQLAKTDRPFHEYCFGNSMQFNLTSSGTIGESQKIDNYVGFFKDPARKFEEMIGVTMEAGKTDTPIETENRMRGVDRDGEEIKGYSRETFWCEPFETLRVARAPHNTANLLHTLALCSCTTRANRRTLLSPRALRDFSIQAIPSTTFAVPTECPQ